jgi:cell division protein FtsA
MEEIIDAVSFEIQNSGFSEKLAAGIVLTGGGALLKHLPQLVKFRTGMDVRIGLPNLHLAGEVVDEINQPMYSTSIGLVLKGFEYSKPDEAKKKDKEEIPIDLMEEDFEEDGNNKRSIFDKFKSTLTEIFAENDMKMD